MASQVLVFIEHDGNEIASITQQLVTCGREQASKLNAQLNALILGHQVDNIVQKVSKMDVDTVYLADDSSLKSYNPEILKTVLTNVVRDLQPRAVLFGDTYITREVVPAVALRLGVPFLSSCVNMELSDSKVTVTQAKYGGVIHVRAELEPVPVTAMLSLQNAPSPPEPELKHVPSISPLKVNVDTQGLRTRMIGVTQKAGAEIDITKADIVVSGGRGLGKKENIALIKELAETLGGVIACSRPLWDIGWLPESCLVGMSGKTISPKVYLACGISGAPQHVAGMSGAKCIIAINKDVNAPIFRVAHYAVVGDALELLPMLIKETIRRKQK